MIEHRSAPLEVRGRTVSGLALPWGERARIRAGLWETFTRGAFGENAALRPVPLRLEHGGPTVGELLPTSTARGLEVRGEYTEDLGARDRFSIEFRARQATRSEDLRIVTAASLEAVAAVELPAYGGAEIEHRRRLGGVKAGFPTGEALDCRCGPADCETATIELDGLVIPDDTPAFLGDFRQPLGAATSVVRDGVVTVEAEVLGTSWGRDMIEAGARNLIVRPYPDAARSEWTKRGTDRLFTRLQVAAWVFTWTDKTGGFESAEVQRRGRLWL